AEADDELDGQEVEEALDEAADAVLGLAVLAGAVLDLDFADFPAAGLGKDGDEAVQLAVEGDLVEDGAAVALHAAVVVVEVDAGGGGNEPVEDAGGEDLVPGVMADFFPAADDVEAGVHFGQEVGDLARVVLEVGVEGHDEVAAGGGETGGECRGL